MTFLFALVSNYGRRVTEAVDTVNVIGKKKQKNEKNFIIEIALLMVKLVKRSRD